MPLEVRITRRLVQFYIRHIFSSIAVFHSEWCKPTILKVWCEYHWCYVNSLQSVMEESQICIFESELS